MTNRRNRATILRDRAMLLEFLRNMHESEVESSWRKAASLVRVGWRESDIQALIKSGEIVSDVRTEYDSQAQYGQASHHFGGAGVCVRHRRYVAVKAAAEISV